MSESSKIWHTYDSTREKDENKKFLLPWQHVRFKTPFLLFLKYSFNHLTGRQYFRLLLSKLFQECQCIQKVNEIHYGPTEE